VSVKLAAIEVATMPMTKICDTGVYWKPEVSMMKRYRAFSDSMHGQSRDLKDELSRFHSERVMSTWLSRDLRNGCALGNNNFSK
jgi:hypothetical protein